jgi:hypothetical protein
MVFLIEANIKVKVRGISGLFSDTAAHLVHAPTITLAREKFETFVRNSKCEMQPENVLFEYTKIATEIL